MSLVKDDENITTKDVDIVDINFSETRKKRFRVDGDNSRIIELNTSDTRLINRLRDIYPKLQELAQKASSAIPAGDDELGMDTFADALAETDKQMRQYVDEIFDSEVAEKCAPHGSMWDPFNGKFTFEYVIEKLLGLYGNNFKSEFNKMTKRMKKHTKKYTK